MSFNLYMIAFLIDFNRGSGKSYFPSRPKYPIYSGTLDIQMPEIQKLQFLFGNRYFISYFVSIIRVLDPESLFLPQNTV